ncbi:hypothetical protein F4678DRAFT_448349 [Xylaria arbuscula]|nr:hypothetical protein F4678DRAFT_448349 [Xylaria arbuscula]
MMPISDPCLYEPTNSTMWWCLSKSFKIFISFSRALVMSGRLSLGHFLANMSGFPVARAWTYRTLSTIENVPSPSLPVSTFRNGRNSWSLKRVSGLSNENTPKQRACSCLNMSWALESFGIRANSKSSENGRCSSVTLSWAVSRTDMSTPARRRIWQIRIFLERCFHGNSLPPLCAAFQVFWNLNKTLDPALTSSFVIGSEPLGFIWSQGRCSSMAMSTSEYH